MAPDNSPVTEDELHAYVDGELPADRIDAVTAWLSTHAEAAALVTAWRAQADAIRARYGSVGDEPVPQRLKVDRLLQRGRSWTAIAAAACIGAFVIGGTAGWFAHGATAASRNGIAALTMEALDAHKLYVVEVRHAVEVNGNEKPHITTWLSKRLGYRLLVPDLQDFGLKLVGGRLLPGATGAAAFYMYENAAGERFTMYCAKATTPASALHYKGEGNVAAFYWVDKDVAYVVSGPADRAKLEKITRAIYDQVEKADVRKL
ncbi:MAG: anti-sigma factor [Xanthobacteraceae bacterium]|uniref:anti-sigma factor family protein n=1 Tax=Pseudolabrys sp. TaxID=1960880 RepID=UPI003D0AA0E2